VLSFDPNRNVVCDFAARPGIPVKVETVRTDNRNFFEIWKMHTMRRIFKTAATIAIIGAAAVALPAANIETRPLTIFFTGLVEGTFGACGCKVGPNGGLARRAGYTASYRSRSRAAVIQVDLGDFFKPLGPHSSEINQLMERGLRQLPVQVLNLAPGDLFRWKDLAEHGIGETQVISTNLVPTKQGIKAPPKHAIVTIAAQELGIEHDLRIGFLGVSDPARVKPNSGFKGLDPRVAVSEAKKEITGQFDFLVLLADIPRNLGKLSKDSVLYRIALDNPEIYAILTTEKRYMLHTPEQVNNAIVLSSVERGRHLGQLTLSLARDGSVEAAEPQFIDMKEGTPEDPELHQAQIELEARLPR